VKRDFRIAPGSPEIIPSPAGGSDSRLQLAICLFISLFLLVPGAVGWALKRSHDPHSVLKGKVFLLISIASFGVSLVVATISFVEYHQLKLALAEGD
jgi:hypothetical protein